MQKTRRNKWTESRTALIVLTVDSNGLIAGRLSTYNIKSCDDWQAVRSKHRIVIGSVPQIGLELSGRKCVMQSKSIRVSEHSANADWGKAVSDCHCPRLHATQHGIEPH